MRREKISIIQLMRTYPTNEVAKRQFEQWRWNGKVRCPNCYSYSCVAVDNNTMPYRCKTCRKRFSVRTNTIMAKSKLDYQQWIISLYIAATGIKGTSSTKLANDLAITQKSAWHLGQRIRKGWEAGNKLSGIVEVDEAYFGGKEANKHASKKTGTRTSEKVAVVGIVQRNGEIRAEVMDANKTEVTQFIERNVAQGSTVYTDESALYHNLTKRGYVHKTVNHSKGEYVRDGGVSTNSIESFWANFKRGYHGTHHHISKKHIQRYIDEFASRQAVRKMDTIDQMSHVFGGMLNKSLSYAKLIGHEGA